MANRARRDKKWAARREAQLLHEQTKTVTTKKGKATLLAIAKTYEDLPSSLGACASSKCVLPVVWVWWGCDRSPDIDAMHVVRLCCAVLCCAVLCCSMLFYAVRVCLCAFPSPILSLPSLL